MRLWVFSKKIRVPHTCTEPSAVKPIWAAQSVKTSGDRTQASVVLQACILRVWQQAEWRDHIKHRLLLLSLALASLPGMVQARSPAGLAEWQFSAGQALMPHFVEAIPKWQRVVSGGVVALPRYEGATAYTVMPALNLELRYKDLAFASTSEGLGVNLLHSRNYRAGVALGFDLGRDETRNPHLTGLDDLQPAPVLKFFGEYVIFPVVLRTAVSHQLGAGGGWDADVGAYMPVIGNKKFFVFLGPSVTFSDGDEMQRSFGVSSAQSSRSGLAVYHAGGGLRSANLGSSASWFFRENWFLNATGGFQHLLGSAQQSPITRSQQQYTLSLMIGKQW